MLRVVAYRQAGGGTAPLLLALGRVDVDGEAHADLERRAHQLAAGAADHPPEMGTKGQPFCTDFLSWITTSKLTHLPLLSCISIDTNLVFRSAPSRRGCRNQYLIRRVFEPCAGSSGVSAPNGFHHCIEIRHICNGFDFILCFRGPPAHLKKLTIVKCIRKEL